jgi:hypothetical protein
VRQRRWWKWLWFAVAVGVAFGLGAWRGTMADGESVHYAVNYPAEGKEAGGPGARGGTGFVVVNVAHTGLLKRITQPNVVNLSTHWLRNVGKKPLRIRLAAEGFTMPIRWDSLELAWDAENHSVSRPLAPGEAITVDWYVTLPRPIPITKVIDEGKLVVYDADTGKALTRLPIAIVNGKVTTGAGGDCCAP